MEKTCLLLISVPPPRIMTHIFHKNVVLLFQRHLTVRNLPFLRKIAVNLVLMWVVRLKQLSGVPRTLQFPPIPNRREPKRLNAKNTAHFIATQVIKLNHCVLSPLPTPRGGGRVLGLTFAGYVPLASQSPYPIIVYFWANYRPYLSHFLENVIFAIST